MVLICGYKMKVTGVFDQPKYLEEQSCLLFALCDAIEIHIDISKNLTYATANKCACDNGQQPGLLQKQCC